MSQMTLQMGIQRVLQEKIPEVEEKYPPGKVVVLRRVMP